MLKILKKLDNIEQKTKKLDNIEQKIDDIENEIKILKEKDGK